MPFDLTRFARINKEPAKQTRAASVVVALSMANLAYLSVWSPLLHHPHRFYHSPVADSPIHYLAALTGVLILALLAFAVVRCLWHGRSKWISYCSGVLFFLFLLPPANFCRNTLGVDLAQLQKPLGLALILSASIGVGVVLVRFRRRLAFLLCWVFAILSPYFVINLAFATVGAINAVAYLPHHDEAEPPATAAQGGYKENHRVIWIVFDELDGLMLGSRRPPGLLLPNFDNLASRSLITWDAQAPTLSTMSSIPSMLLGKKIHDAIPDSGSNLKIKLTNSSAEVNFSSLDSVADDASAVGARFFALGWYHPYGRMFYGRRIAGGASFGYGDFASVRARSYGECVWNQLLLAVSPYEHRRARNRQLEQIWEAAITACKDESKKVVFLHMPIPHLPQVYNLGAREMVPPLIRGYSNYINNILLTDRNLGELLNAIRTTGSANRTSIIVTADHCWRSAPWREKNSQSNAVPLLVSVAGQFEGKALSGKPSVDAIRGIVSLLLTGANSDQVARDLEMQTSTSVN